MIVTYIKYLSRIEPGNQMCEVNLFKQFLINNQQIKNRVFDDPNFKTGKHSLTLAMDNFLSNSEEQNSIFWESLIELDNLLFNNAKPLPSLSDPSVTSLSGALSNLENNLIFSDVVEQIKSSVSNLNDITDVGSIMNLPDFKSMVEKVKSGLTTGKYKLADLTSTMSTIINAVQNDVDPETRNTLKTVSETIESVERGEPPDVSKIIDAVTSLKINKNDNLIDFDK